MQAAAQALGQLIRLSRSAPKNEIETAFTTLVRRGADALHVGTDAFFVNPSESDCALALAMRYPPSMGTA